MKQKRMKCNVKVKSKGKINRQRGMINIRISVIVSVN